MSFFRTEMLLLIWLLPLLAAVMVYGARRRQKILERFSSTRGLDAITPTGLAGRRWIKAGLLLAAVFFLTIALAGPRYGYRWQQIHRQGIDIVIALDVSRSMTVDDIAPSRLERAKREVFDLLAMLEGDRVGLVAFSGTAFLQCPLTLDYSAFHLFLDSLSPESMPVGGTHLTAALQAAQEAFDADSNTDKAVILITDGENTGTGDPLEAAMAFKEQEIKLFCIGVGGNDGVPIPAATGGFQKDRGGQIVLSRLDETTLKKMAVATGGTYVRSVAGDMDLDAIYKEEIRSTMDAREIESGRKQIWEDRFQWPLALGLICLVAHLMLPVTRKKVATLLLTLVMAAPAAVSQASDTSKGMEAFEQGRYEEALTHFTDAQLNDPDDPTLLYNVGNAYYKTGDYGAAADHYRQVVQNEDAALKAKALYNLGNAEFKQGNAEKAIGQYEAALELDADNQLARENLEFVKKALEQQQKQPQQGQQKPDDSPNEQDGEKQPQNSKPKDQGEEHPGKDEGQQESVDQPQQPEPGERDEQKAGDQQPQTAQPHQATPSDDAPADPGHAQRMLNRLQDQPGRALMPAMGEQQVERDW